MKVPTSACASRPAPPESADFVERLRYSLGRRFGDPEGWEIERVSKHGPPGRERNVFFARNLDSGQRLAVKANSKPTANRQQYRALCNLRRHTRDCVTPLYLARDSRFFVMEWIDAPALLKQLHVSGLEREQALARAGAWLARLQSATSERPPAGSRLHKVRLLTLFSRGPLRCAAANLAARMRCVPLQSGPVAMLHGDFQPGNLFDLGDRLVAFDRQSDRHGVSFFDAAWFLSHLSDTRDRLIRKKQPWPGELDADRRAFFEGYGPLDEDKLALFDLVEDLVLFSRWRYLLRRNNHRLDEQVRLRGLLDADQPASRPGRLVVRSSGGGLWSKEPAPIHRRSLSVASAFVRRSSRAKR